MRVYLSSSLPPPPLIIKMPTLTVAGERLQAIQGEIKRLCRNDESVSESECVESLRELLMTAHGKEAAKTIDLIGNKGHTMLHYAAGCCRSPQFCQLLLEIDDEMMIKKDNLGQLPLHLACGSGRKFNSQNQKINSSPEEYKLPLIKLLVEYFPSTLSHRCIDGCSPIRCYLVSGFHIIRDIDLHWFLEGFRYLLKMAPSTANDVGFAYDVDVGTANDVDPTNYHTLLHLAVFGAVYCCSSDFSIALLTEIFNASPTNIYALSVYEETPLDMARRRGDDISEFELDRAQRTEAEAITIYEKVISFLEFQHHMSMSANIKRRDQNWQLAMHKAVQMNGVTSGTLELMTIANLNGPYAIDIKGMIPMHIACQAGCVGMIEFFIRYDKRLLRSADRLLNRALHHACLGGKCANINCIMRETYEGAALENADGHLPIEILFYHADCDRDSFEYTEAVFHLLRANPDSLVELTSNEWRSDSFLPTVPLSEAIHRICGQDPSIERLEVTDKCIDVLQEFEFSDDCRDYGGRGKANIQHFQYERRGESGWYEFLGSLIGSLSNLRHLAFDSLDPEIEVLNGFCLGILGLNNIAPNASLRSVEIVNMDLQSPGNFLCWFHTQNVKSILFRDCTIGPRIGEHLANENFDCKEDRPFEHKGMTNTRREIILCGCELIYIEDHQSVIDFCTGLAQIKGLRSLTVHKCFFRNESISIERFFKKMIEELLPEINVTSSFPIPEVDANVLAEKL